MYEDPVQMEFGLVRYQRMIITELFSFDTLSFAEDGDSILYSFS